MADTKISALAAVSAVASTNEFAVNEAGVSKKATAAQVKTFVGSWTDFTQDLGASRTSGTFDITGLSGLTASKVVAVVQTAAQITSKGNARDEAEMAIILATGYVVDAATIRVYWWSSSVCVGTYAFAYLVSG